MASTKISNPRGKRSKSKKHSRKRNASRSHRKSRARRSNPRKHSYRAKAKSHARRSNPGRARRHGRSRRRNPSIGGINVQQLLIDLLTAAAGGGAQIALASFVEETEAYKKFAGENPKGGPVLLFGGSAAVQAIASVFAKKKGMPAVAKFLEAASAASAVLLVDRLAKPQIYKLVTGKEMPVAALPGPSKDKQGGYDRAAFAAFQHSPSAFAGAGMMRIGLDGMPAGFSVDQGQAANAFSGY